MISARRRLAAFAAVALTSGGLAGCADEPTPAPELTGATNPFAARSLYLNPSPRLEAAALQAASDGDSHRAEVLERIAGVPAGIWLTPEKYPPQQVGPFVNSVVSAAEADQSLPVFVIYGVPDRDCTGGFSAGGLTPETYGPWVSEIAEAAGSTSTVILEPDAVPSLVQCGAANQRIQLLSNAVTALTTAGVTTYIDAGHSDWVPPEEIAPLLKEVGIDQVRGFATNVSNYQPERLEMEFASRLSARLQGAHYVIDTSRNGDPNGAEQVVTDWCNPPKRSLGQQPGFVDDGTRLDALLWIKPPAESDGTCHGGPTAGEVWIERAVDLAYTTGW
ncbi:MAG: glycoside hydrolase family 6 protein [Nocardioides sp.]